jgi:hypothetical protein
MTNAALAWVAAAASVLLIGGFLAVDALDEDAATGGTLDNTRWVVTETPGVARVPDGDRHAGSGVQRAASGRHLLRRRR